MLAIIVIARCWFRSKPYIFSVYDTADIGRKNRCGFWSGAQAQHRLGNRESLGRTGARLIFNYQGERLKENVEELIGEFGEKTPLFPCDVSSDDEIKAFFGKVRRETDRLELSCTHLRSRPEKRWIPPVIPIAGMIQKHRHSAALLKSLAAERSQQEREPKFADARPSLRRLPLGELN